MANEQEPVEAIGETTQSLDLSKIEIVKLSEVYDISRFDCGDNDINEFLRNDALNYQKEKIAVTTLFIFENNILGFCSLASDAVKLERKTEEEKIRTELGRGYSEYPALKLARFGRDKRFKKSGVGKFILNYVVGKAISLNDDAAIRFVSLDSYANRVEYYKGYGFVENLHRHYQERGERTETFSMRLDLKFVYQS